MIGLLYIYTQFSLYLVCKLYLNSRINQVLKVKSKMTDLLVGKGIYDHKGT
jgi:hypothetical protein